MHCKTLRYWLVEYADNALDTKHRTQIETHLSECPACAALTREMTETRDVLRGLAPVQTSMQFDDRLAARLAEARRSKETVSWWSNLFPSSNWLRPALALGAAACALTGAALMHTFVSAPAHPAASDDAALITQCVALHQRDVAAQPLTDAAATGIGHEGWTGDAASNAAQEDNL
jgi:anti-sigma factor RsiW